MTKIMLIFATDMYSLKDAWAIMLGSLPYEDWDGKLYCTKTDAAITYRTNKTQGYVAAYTFTLVIKGSLHIVYNGKTITLLPDDLYLYSPGMAVSIVEASDDYQGICLLADEQTTIEMPAVHDLVQIAYAPIVQLHEPKQKLPHDDALRLAAKMREIIDYLHSNHIYKNEILRMLYAVFLLDIQDTQKRVIANHSVPQRVEEIFIDFIRLIPKHFIEHRDIAFYASALTQDGYEARTGSSQRAMSR